MNYQIFSNESTTAILKIKWPSIYEEDQLMWKGKNSGAFLVKSSYFLNFVEEGERIQSGMRKDTSQSWSPSLFPVNLHLLLKWWPWSGQLRKWSTEVGVRFFGPRTLWWLSRRLCRRRSQRDGAQDFWCWRLRGDLWIPIGFFTGTVELQISLQMQFLKTLFLKT